MIIGTAGHIDHGKTSLVRALTGVDTDRLPEEKKRGITIELGYAYLPTPQGDMLGFVDVPGHERFLHTMLAGATGIDFGLLVVAADDGVMPQTREHLDVLHLLGVAHGAVAITKMDRVDAARLAEVEAELRNLLAPTALADVPFFPVCSLSGQGVDDLRQHLFASASAATAPALDGRFRLAVDRSFTLEGLGTVVTGYVVSGSVRVDDNLILAPRAANTSVRVRGLRALNRAVDSGVAGQRCALNLAGIERSEVTRGDWVVDAASALASERWDVRLKLLPGEAKPLRTGAQVHVHVGAWHGMARVVTLEGNNIEPGQSALAQLVLDRPASAWHGDRLILRDASAQRTLGGGQVIEPLGPARYRRTPERLAQLAALELADPVASLGALAAVSPLGVDVAQFLRCRDRHPLPANIHLPGLRRLSAEGVDIVFTDAEWQKLSERVLAETARFHETHPEDIGLDAGRLKRQAFPKLADRALTALVAALVAEGRLARQGVWLQLPVHAEQLGAQDQRLAQRILPLLVDGRFDPPWVRDISKSIDTPESMVRGVLNRMARRGETFQVVKDLHYSPAAMREAALLAERLQAEHGAIRAAEFRDGTNLGRKRAIQILEYFDRIGFTRRLGDDHVIRSRALLIPEAANASASSAPP